MKRSLLSISLGLVCSLSILAAPLASAAGPDTNGWPNSIASTGDSITRAFNTGTVPFTDAPANSWSTGTNTSVNSHYLRILAANPSINGHNYNDAVSGSKMAALNGQIGTVNGQHVDYVTVLMGANDACTPTEAQMTPVATFRAQFQTALDTFSAGSPDARIYVMSVPNIYNLWYILHDNASARTAWSLFSICQSMLVNPQSFAQEDIDRRNRVNQRVIDFNTQLVQVCATDIHCRFDSNVVYNTPFTPSEVSTRDYFHPSLTGQARLAMVTYAAGFDFTDASPPVSWAAPYISAPESPPLTVALKARDNAGVAGIEYRIDQGAITRYTDFPITIPTGSTLTLRAVDVNGNNEVWHSITPSLGSGSKH
jgi:lysophospholipase L1-like esterase